MNRRLLVLIVVLPALFLALAGGARAGTPAALLPSFTGQLNHSFETATPIDAYYGNLRGYFASPGEEDYYRFETVTAARLVFEIYTGAAVGDAPVTAEVAIYDAAHVLLAKSATCNQSAAAEVIAPPGVYYVRVRLCAGMPDVDDPYDIELYVNPIELEPNGTRGAANALLLPYNEFDYRADYLDATIDPAGDVDFYYVQGMGGEAFSAEAISDDGQPMALTLMSSSGAVIAEGDPCPYDANHACLHAILPDSATYYLRARTATHPVGSGAYWIDAQLRDRLRDTEPNDTPAQAPLIGYGASVVIKTGDLASVDYYQFNGQAGDKVRLLMLDGDVPDYDTFLVELFDPAMNPVLLSGEPAKRAVLPAAGLYTIRVSVPADLGEGYWFDQYFLNLARDVGDEPNDTMETATPIEIGPEITFIFDYLCDEDWYKFQGRAGDVLQDVGTELSYENVSIYKADGEYLGGNVLPADGIYYLRALGEYNPMDDYYCYDGPQRRGFVEALWVSAAANKLGGNAAIKNSDIVTRKAGGQWQIVFDASDVGIKKNLVAFEVMPNGTILMSLAAAQKVPGLGKVMPHDIIRFVPTSLGDDTAGTFQWFLDGSDVGLTTAGEKIDAFTMFRDIQNPLRLSTTGAGKVPRTSGGTLKFADEDLVNFVGTSYGADSAGTFRMHLDGSSVPGMAKTDLGAVTRVELLPQRTSVLLVSMSSKFTINGYKGTPFDVMDGENWQPILKKFTNKKIDALGIGPAAIP